MTVQKLARALDAFWFVPGTAGLVLVGAGQNETKIRQHVDPNFSV